MNFGGKVESGRQKHEMAASVALGDGDLQNIPSGVHNMRTVLDATSDAEATQEQALGIDRLAVIVPVYNEERTVAELLRCLEAQPCVSQIVIVDDGSTDRTWEELAPWRARASFAGTVPVPDGDSFSAIVVQHDKNRGKGRAIRTGLDLVKCSHVLIQDADLEYNPGDISTLWQVMQSEQVDVVYGSRYLNLPNLQRGRFILQSGVRFLNLVTWFVYGVSLTDEATCYKMFHTIDLRRMGLQCERFEFCPEVTAKAARSKLRIKECAVSYCSRGVSAGKKLRLRDGFAAVMQMWKYRNWIGL